MLAILSLCSRLVPVPGFVNVPGLRVGSVYSAVVTQIGPTGLLQATQKGGSSNSADSRIRTFTYNSLGQLLCSANPEIGSPLAAVATCPVVDSGTYIAGTVRYQYNDEGLVTSKTAPLPNQTGTSTVVTSYSYDVLHRVLNRTYSDGTAAVAYTYDGTVATACTSPNVTGSNYPVGHISSMCDGSGSTAWKYDQMGRTAAEARTIGSVTDQIGYTYYLNNATNTVTYPLSGATTAFSVTYHQNAAGRFDSVVGSDGVTYASVSSTWASGASNASQLGSGIQLANSYNTRLQPLSMTATQISPSKTLFSRTYDFHSGAGDNGNLWGVVDGLDQLGLNRPNGSVQYSYDALNRITSAQTSGTDCSVKPGGSKDWGNVFTVDAWGNLIGKTVTKCSAESLSSSADNRNRLTAASYDSAGEVISKDGVAYSYDAEGRVVSAAGVSYVYDGAGERVQKPGKLYWKGLGSTALVETDASDRNPVQYIFFNGSRIARRDPGASSPKYYVSDSLGSTALVTDATGNVLNESLFFPYGGERIIANADTGNNYKFTGKERDPETGLDDFGARYYASNLGRFMTPDWDAKPTNVPYASFGDPQTLNLFSYVENGPLNRVDADGHLSGNPNVSTPYLEAPELAYCSGQDSMHCRLDMPGVHTDGNPSYTSSEDEAKYDAMVKETTAQHSQSKQQKTLPDNPSGLGDGWKDVTPQGGKNPKIPKRYRGPKGSEIEFDPADPDKSPKTWGGKNHWHEVGPGGKREDGHLAPGAAIPGPDGAPDARVQHPSARQIGIGIGGAAAGYLIYRGLRMLPSVVVPPLWPTIPLNAVIP